MSIISHIKEVEDILNEKGELTLKYDSLSNMDKIKFLFLARDRIKDQNKNLILSLPFSSLYKEEYDSISKYIIMAAKNKIRILSNSMGIIQDDDEITCQNYLKNESIIKEIVLFLKRKESSSLNILLKLEISIKDIEDHPLIKEIRKNCSIEEMKKIKVLYNNSADYKDPAPIVYNIADNLAFNIVLTSFKNSKKEIYVSYDISYEQHANIRKALEKRINIFDTSVSRSKLLFQF